MRRRRTFNPKRRIQERCDPEELRKLAQKVRYGGHPEHKRNPGDFNLVPPAQPRSDKTLCDEASRHKRSVAQNLLRQGAERGLISVQKCSEFPQNIWAVTSDGYLVEAQLDNSEQGVPRLPYAADRPIE
jgi:hypothetical protein